VWAPQGNPRRQAMDEFRVVLISTYELGRQPFGLASPAAWLRDAGCRVACLDVSVQSLDEGIVSSADLVAFYVPMHTATRLAATVLPRVKTLMTCMAIIVALQLAIAFTLRHRDERLRRVGMLGATALALIRLLITATLVVAVGILLAAFVIDSALGVRPADLNQILSEVGVAQYVSAEDMVIAIPIVGWLGLLNARLALGALSETSCKPSVSS
jgi:hypothetical protein